MQKHRGDGQRKFPPDTRTPGQIIRDEQRLMRDQGRKKEKLSRNRAKKREDFERSLHQWRNDFDMMEKRDPPLLRRPLRTGSGNTRREGVRPKTASSSSGRQRQTEAKAKMKRKTRWWSSVDVHLRNAKWAATSSDKVLQWQRELDRRRALDKLKPQVLQDYIGSEAVREQTVRKNFLLVKYTHKAVLPPRPSDGKVYSPIYNFYMISLSV